MTMNYYRFYPGDYARDTAHLSLLEHGAFRVLLDTYYATGQPLPNDPDKLYRITRATTTEERAAVDSVTRQFFYADAGANAHANGGALRNRKADELLAHDQKKIENARKAAKIMHSHQNDMQTHVRTHVQSHVRSGAGAGDGASREGESGGKPWTPTQDQLSLNALFSRRPTTPWSAKEQKTLRELQKRPEWVGELAEIVAYYTAKGKTEDAKYLKRELETLLNNWTGQLDQARKWVAPSSKPYIKPMRSSEDFE